MVGFIKGLGLFREVLNGESPWAKPGTDVDDNRDRWAMS